LADEGIVRHRGKIEAVINNARIARDLVAREGSLAAFFWRYAPDWGVINDHAGQCVVRAKVAQARGQFERPRGAICTGTADGG
jgi:DNA-3-methyladenine glycosylase I